LNKRLRFAHPFLTATVEKIVLGQRSAAAQIAKNRAISLTQLERERCAL